MNRRTTPLFAALGTALIGLAACQPVPIKPNPDPVVTTTTTIPPAPVTTTVPEPTTTTTTVPPAPSGWTLIGGDEFDDNTVDTAAWKRYHNTYGDGNNEMACLRPENAIEGGGSLSITARKEAVTCPGGKARQYTSGFLGSREVGRYYPMYGRFEIRARLPHAQGLWPAFWLRHRNGASTAEVDILEYFHSAHPGMSSGTLHLDGKKNTTQSVIGFEPSSVEVSGWHTWAVDISPDSGNVRFDFYLDGQKYHTYTDAQHAWASSDPNATWDIAVNMAVGGSWIGGPDDTLGYLRDVNRCSQGGVAPDACNTAGIRRVNWADPAATTYEIDYIRVFSRT